MRVLAAVVWRPSRSYVLLSAAASDGAVAIGVVAAADGADVTRGHAGGARLQVVRTLADGAGEESDSVSHAPAVLGDAAVAACDSRVSVPL